MDSSAAQQLTDIKFTQKKKGYDPEEVDNFLEKLGDAVVKLQEKVKEATRRADDAEARAASAVSGSRPPEDDDEVVDRAGKTLLMAQKAADEVTETAQQEADKVQDDARQKATRIVEDANRDSAKKLADAETELARVTDDQASVVKERMAGLETQRDDLVADVESLEEHIELLRGRVRIGVDQLSELLEHPENFRPSARPELKTPGRPSLLAAEGAIDGDAVVDAPSAEAPEAEAADSDPTRAIDTLAADESDESDDAVGESSADTDTDPEADLSAPDDDSTTESTRPPRGSSLFAADDEPDDPAESSPGLPTRGAAPTSAVGSSVGSVEASTDPIGGADSSGAAAAPPSGDDDGFLDELKRAVTDDSPLGVADEQADAAMRAFFDGEPATDAKKSRFGRNKN